MRTEASEPLVAYNTPNLQGLKNRIIESLDTAVDEVWFVEKGKDGASHLTSLAEFKPREDVRKGYLLGRYGAIPLLPNEAMKW